MPIRIEHCLVCDDFRVEAAGKTTLLGFFGLTPHVEIRVGELNKPVERLTFVILTEPADNNQHKLQVELLDPSGHKFASLGPADLPAASRRLQLAFGFSAILFRAVGTHTVRIKIDDTNAFEGTFDVELMTDNTQTQ